MDRLTSQLSNLSLLEAQQQLLQQQKTLHISNLITAFDDPSIKKLQQYNKNKVERELLDIATNFHSMIQKLQMIQFFCMDYKKTLQSYRKEQLELQKQRQRQEEIQAQNDLKAFNGKDSKMIDQSVQSIIPKIFQQQLTIIPNDYRNLSSMTQAQMLSNLQAQQQEVQPQLNPKPLVVLPAKRLQTNKQQIQSVINKLKVMIVKVNTKQSSSFEHVYSTYISRLKYTLEHSNLKQRQFKMSVIRIMLNYLRRKYVFLKQQARYIYPFHPTRCPNSQLIQFHYNESLMFFINFFAQQLLFFNCEPITLKANFSDLLYCPIVLIKGKPEETIKISQWYYEQLNLIQPLWRSTILLIKIFNVNTSLKHPVYYSHIPTKKFQFQNELKNQLDQIHSHFPFMEHTHRNEEQLLSDLETIKQFIYQTLIFNHLQKVLNKEPSSVKEVNKVHINIEGGFRVQFQLVADLQVKETLKNVLNPKKSEIQRKITLAGLFDLPQNTNEAYPQPVYKSQLIADLLLFYKKKNLFTFKRSTLLQDLQILFKTTLFKLLTEDIEYRTVSPAYSGSIGLYYYEKKTIKKNSVLDFLNNFAEK